MSFTSRIASRSRPTIRPLRPPNVHRSQPSPRFFANNRQLLLVISKGIPRPQVPYLDHTLHALLRNNGALKRQARYISVQSSISFWRHVIVNGIKYGVLMFVVYVGAMILRLIFQLETIGHTYVVPDEWSYWTKMMYFGAWKAQTDNPASVNWVLVGYRFLQVLSRVENPEVDGKGLKENEDGGAVIADAGKTGFDLTEKSEPWRRIYFELLMAAANACHHLDGWVHDKTTGILYPGDVVLGPSNPYPKPVLPGQEAPLEENVEPVPWLQPAETLYIKILTSKGFTTTQRTDAAIAYGNLLQDKDLLDSAGEVYQWALDIATSELPDATSIVDPQTSTITDPTRATRNLINVLTSLATHRAKTENLSSALSIYLSVLRSRRAAPTLPQSPPSRPSLLSQFLVYCRPWPFPPPPPSGDSPFINTPTDPVDEALLLSYIGEVLFTTSATQHEAGLRWTRDALALAESSFYNSLLPVPQQNRALETAEIALFNLRTMLETVAARDTQAVVAEFEKGGVLGVNWPTWLGGESQERKIERADRELTGRSEMWKREMEGVEKKLGDLRGESYGRLASEKKGIVDYLIMGGQGGFLKR